MMRAALALALSVMLAAPAAQAGVAEEAQKAAEDLAAAVAALDAADRSKDRVAALTQTIRAYEQGLAALREALRQADLREATLLTSFEARRDRLSRLIGALSALEPQAGTMLLLHPEGALETVQSGMLMADVTPGLKAEADAVAAQLQELRDLRALQLSAGEVLTEGLTAATAARSALSQAISDRTDLPAKFTEDPETLKQLLQSADTLQAFAEGLNLDDEAPSGFADQKGRLPLPALGTVILRPGQMDARGVARPGVTLATRPRALVTAPFSGTIRYLGPLLDYGNVMILEPGDGYLLILSGLEQLYGDVGHVLPAGAALGLMGGSDAAAGAEETANGSGAGQSETLYMELRQGAEPVDPSDWFAL